jgi:hypothetical protein
VRARLLPDWQLAFKPFDDGFLFSRYTVLWLMRQAFLHSSPDGEPVNNRAVIQRLGVACLIGNDLSAYQKPRRLAGHLELAANLLPNSDCFSQEEYFKDIARTHLMLTELAQSAPHAALRNLPRRVEELLGYSLDQSCDLTLAAAMKSVIADTSDIDRYVTPAVRAENFQTTPVNSEMATSFLGSVSTDDTNFHEMIKGARTSASDLTVFRRFPMLQLNDTDFVVLDVGFLLDKAGRSLIWSAVKNCTSQSEATRILGYWGELFELYVNRLLGEVGHPQRLLLCNARFPDGTEAVDSCVVEGRTLVAIETKSTTLPNSVRYSDNADLLRAALERKFVVGDESGAKGVSQLASFIQRFSAGEPIRSEPAGQTIDINSIGKVIPVLVHLDHSLRTVRINHYLAERLKAMIRVKRPVITPLAVVSITELEQLQGIFADVLLSDVLESYLRTLWTNPAAIFLAGKVPVLQGKEGKAGPTQQRISNILDGTLKRLFPEPSTAT